MQETRESPNVEASKEKRKFVPERVIKLAQKARALVDKGYRERKAEEQRQLAEVRRRLARQEIEEGNKAFIEAYDAAERKITPLSELTEAHVARPLHSNYDVEQAMQPIPPAIRTLAKLAASEVYPREAAVEQGRIEEITKRARLVGRVHVSSLMNQGEYRGSVAITSRDTEDDTRVWASDFILEQYDESSPKRGGSIESKWVAGMKDGEAHILGTNFDLSSQARKEQTTVADFLERQGIRPIGTIRSIDFDRFGGDLGPSALPTPVPTK